MGLVMGITMQLRTHAHSNSTCHSDREDVTVQCNVRHVSFTLFRQIEYHVPCSTSRIAHQRACRHRGSRRVARHHRRLLLCGVGRP